MGLLSFLSLTLLLTAVRISVATSSPGLQALRLNERAVLGEASDGLGTQAALDPGSVPSGTAVNQTSATAVDAARKATRTVPTQPATPMKTAIKLEDDGFYGRKYQLGQCWIREHSDRSGEYLVNGWDLKLNTTAECCQACADYKPVKEKSFAPCNVWNYCDGSNSNCTAGHCWLKYQPRPWGMHVISHPSQGGMSGTIIPPPELPVSTVKPGDDRSYHIVVSAQGEAVHWQMRINYYHYKKVKKQCQAQPKCEMGGYTRLLHSGKPDDLMYEIPTYVVDKLPEGLEDPTYLALNRPYAFMQWSKQAVIPEKYIFMMEPDHVWVRPMPNIMINDRPIGYPFFYMEPATSGMLKVMQKFLGPLSRSEIEQKVAPLGSSPMLITMGDLQKVAPLWLAYGTIIHKDVEANKAFGFVKEMYAFIIGLYHAGILDTDLSPEMMAQPPYDNLYMGAYYIMHYTYAFEYREDGSHWGSYDAPYRYDKRKYAHVIQPRNLTMPPAGVQNDQVWWVLNAMKEAMNAIPDWDQYEKDKVAKKLWNGVL
ncbi:hypothetical protein ACKKBG_A18975 [Auxenochlorella protothecoides x Auxenochlorella symbiontica]